MIKKKKKGKKLGIDGNFSPSQRYLWKPSENTTLNDEIPSTFGNKAKLPALDIILNTVLKNG